MCPSFTSEYTEWVPHSVLRLCGKNARQLLVWSSDPEPIHLDAWADAEHIIRVRIIDCLLERDWYWYCIRSQGLNHCRFIDHDYTRLSSMSYVDALNYTVGKQTPSTVSCIYHPMGQIKYDMEGSSIVPEVNWFISTYFRLRWKMFTVGFGVREQCVADSCSSNHVSWQMYWRLNRRYYVGQIWSKDSIHRRLRSFWRI